MSKDKIMPEAMKASILEMIRKAKKVGFHRDELIYLDEDYASHSTKKIHAIRGANAVFLVRTGGAPLYYILDEDVMSEFVTVAHQRSLDIVNGVETVIETKAAEVKKPTSFEWTLVDTTTDGCNVATTWYSCYRGVKWMKVVIANGGTVVSVALTSSPA